MLRALLISPDPARTQQFEAAVTALGSVDVVRRLPQYPSAAQLDRLVRVHAPRVIFLDAAALSEAVAVARTVEVSRPGLEVVAFHETAHPALLLELMRVGVREFLAAPFPPEAVSDVLRRVAERVGRTPLPVDATDLVLSFLPAKAGVGTTTVAVNLSMALAEQLQEPVLLADFDLNCGIVGFMLKLEPRYSLTDVAERADRLDESMWEQLICSVGRLHVLPSGKVDLGFRIEASQIRTLIDFARRHYKAVCVDLSGNMEKYSVELMHESKWILLVTTPELPALYLARQKLAFLRSVELEHRVKVALNRVHKRMSISVEEIERLLGVPVSMPFYNDYAGVHKALQDGAPVSPSSALGRQFHRFAAEFCGQPKHVEPQNQGVLSYLGLTPARRLAS
ncbi:MAG: AAA family ATPase [Bryobacterales bacterium]|nr:AAA family ATPase [Bryobacteraceae bacterium]MDW8354226.1 AAA family ATPase [Bryobacterales bacterium]